jgi:hypothetical protein
VLGRAPRLVILGPLAFLWTLLGFSIIEGGQNACDEAIGRALRLLPRQPEKVTVVERAEASLQYKRRPRVEAFANPADRVIYLVRQGATLQGALKGPGIFDYALAGVIWHEMAHLDGAGETAAQQAEEQLWMQFVLSQRVDRTRGLQYLALLEKRR